MRLLDREIDRDLDYDIISLLVEIIKPTPIRDYVSNLPSQQDVIYRKGGEKIKSSV